MKKTIKKLTSLQIEMKTIKKEKGIIVKNKKEIISNEKYNMILDSVSFFESLGGTETYKKHILTSVSPNGEIVVTRDFRSI